MKRIAFVSLMLALAVSISLTGASARAGAQAGGDLLRLLPDGGAVAVVDVQRTLTSSFWTTVSSHDKIRGTFEKVQTELSGVGLRLSDVRTVAVVLPSGNTKDFTGVVSGSFNQNDILSRLRAKQNVKVTSETYKNVEIFQVNDAPKAVATAQAEPKPAAKNNGFYFAFYDAGTIAIGNLAGVQASIDARSGARPSIAQNAKLGAVMAENPAAAIRFAAEVTPAMTQGIQTGGVPIPDLSSIKMVFGTIDVTSSIDINATLRHDTAEHAKAISDQLNGLFGMLKGFLGSSSDPKLAPIAGALDSVRIANTDVDVKITGSLSQDVLVHILK
ncbi:MAG TPA: hypothetical protein VE262_12685 [Blastocatellia bacterium]|nr:hypothetical protein [Blastocatellia bacterium]